MNKNTLVSKTRDDHSRLPAKAKLVAIKVAKPSNPISLHDPIDGHRLAELNRLANAPPFCTTHRGKNNDIL